MGSLVLEVCKGIFFLISIVLAVFNLFFCVLILCSFLISAFSLFCVFLLLHFCVLID